MINFFKNRKEFGNYGEKIACDYLKHKGLKLIKKNFRFQKCEIDLIFLDEKNKIVIFIEVKSRKNKTYGEPEESITYSKQRNIQKAAQGFITENKMFEYYDLRFDTVSIMMRGNSEFKINHIECAF